MNLTLDTIKGQEEGKIFHMNLDNLLLELTPGKCEFGIYMVFDPKLTKEKLILGKEFIDSYELSFNYENSKLALKGYFTDSIEPKPKPKPPTPNPDNPSDPGNNSGESGMPSKTVTILIIAGAAVAILGIAICVIRKIRNKRLARDLEHEPLV